MDDTETTAVRLLIRGRVQGVWFRAWTRERAQYRELDGWIRNRRDGAVEAVFSGPAEAVREMVAECHEGPPYARVARVTERPVKETVAPGFHMLPSE